jgi:hypothetical protein
MAAIRRVCKDLMGISNNPEYDSSFGTLCHAEGVEWIDGQAGNSWLVYLKETDGR